MTFNEVKKEYMQSKIDFDGVKESTLSVIATQYKSYIEPILGNNVIEDFRSRDLQEFVNTLLTEKNLSIHTTRDLASRVKNIVGYVQWKYEIPVYKLVVKYPPQKAIAQFDYEKTFTNDEQLKILRAISDNPSIHNMAVALILFTGCRIGEICALRWENYDLGKNSVRVEHTLERIYDPYGNRTKIVIQAAKTATSRREIPLPDVLKSWMQSQQCVNLPNWFIVSGSHKPVEPRLMRTYYYRLLESAGVRPLSPHKMRHTFASNLIASGGDIKTVSTLLGHADTSITLDIYTHIDLSKKKNVIDSFWGRTKKKEKKQSTLTILQERTASL